MERLRDNLPIVIAVTASVLLHVFVLFPALGLMAAGGPWWSDHVREASLDPGEDRTPADSGLADGLDDGLEDETDRLSPEERERLRNARAADSARRALQERRNRDKQLPPEEQESVRLGIDESSAVTMNWIGYEEYEEHLAELAEVEQAAYRLAEASGASGTADSNAPPVPPSPSVAVSPNPSPLPLPPSDGSALAGSAASASGVTEPTAARAATPPSDAALADGNEAERARPLPPPESAAAETGSAVDPQQSIAPVGAGPDPIVGPSESEPAPAPPDPSRVDPQAEPRSDPATDPDDPVSPTPTDPTTPGVVPEVAPRETTNPAPEATVRPSEATEAREAPPLPEATDESTVSDAGQVRPDARPEASTESPSSEAPQGGGLPGERASEGTSTTPAQPAPRGTKSDNPSAAGELSDRESDATSTIRVEAAHWRNGRPLAAKGLTLKPSRPRFTTLNYVDGIGRNPIAELQFARDGVPQVARLVRSTGNPGVDDAIRAALFKWRASGEQLEKLKPGQTVTIRLQLIMLAD